MRGSTALLGVTAFWVGTGRIRILPMPTTPPARRRWYQFSLGTMLIVVTVVCVWLGYELNWIGQRHAIIKDCYSHVEDAGLRAAPGLLWLFGEPGYREIRPRYYTVNWYPLFTPQAAEEHRLERKRIRSLFPEVETIALELNPPKVDDGTAEARIAQIGDRLAEIEADPASRKPQERFKLRDERRVLERQLGRPLTDPPPQNEWFGR
jgi:hypothetical protein